MLIIIASMDQELAGLRKKLRRGWRPCSTDRLSNSDGSLPVELRTVGIGQKAGLSLRSILERSNQRPLGLLLLGVAGAVDPDLTTGDLTLSSRYYLMDANGGKSEDLTERGEMADFIEPTPELWQWAVEAGEDMDKPVVYADSLTVNHLVTTPRSKDAIRSHYPVGILDMEDYWIALVAQKAGVPFVSARVVLDQATQSVPGYLIAMAGSKTKAYLSLMAMPWRIPTVVRLGSQFTMAQRTLSEFALNFMTQVSHGVSMPDCEAPIAKSLSSEE